MKRAASVLLLLAIPVFATAAQFVPGDVVTSGWGQRPAQNWVDFYSLPIQIWSRTAFGQSQAITIFPRVTAAAYSAALGKMVLAVTPSLDLFGQNSVVILGSDGALTPLLTLPPTSRLMAFSTAGPDLLAMVYVSDVLSDNVQLWRIALAGGAVLEQIPIPLFYGDVSSIDLAADRCTLVFATANELIGRYDICRRRALPDIAAQGAKAIRILPGGDVVALTGFGTRLVRYDRDGRLVSTLLPSFSGPVVIPVSFETMTLDPDGSTLWLSSYGPAPLKTFNISTGEMASPSPPIGGGSVIAVAGEWRAAEQPLPRRRAAR